MLLKAKKKNLTKLLSLGRRNLLDSNTKLPFIINFAVSAFAGKKVGDNPWEATTLDWACPSPPPHGNFTTPPEVFRGPYEYSNPEHTAKDFWPQSEPPHAGAPAPVKA